MKKWMYNVITHDMFKPFNGSFLAIVYVDVNNPSNTPKDKYTSFHSGIDKMVYKLYHPYNYRELMGNIL